MRPPWLDEDEVPELRLPVIDLPVPRPEHERVARALGKCIGIAAVLLAVAAIWTFRGAAWAAGRAWRARQGPGGAT